MTAEEFDEKLDEILWDLWDLAKNPNKATKYHSVADASKDIYKLFGKQDA